MRVLGRHRLRHRAPRALAARPRRSLVVELPEAPDPYDGPRNAPRHRPSPLTLPLGDSTPRWAFATAGAPGFAAFLAALDLAAPGAVLDVGQGGPAGGEHALLAAVYSTRLVRALAPDAARAHATRQAAATNRLAVVVEQRRLAPAAAGGAAARETLDAYVARTAVEPALLRLADERVAAALLDGARLLLALRRPWVVLGPGAETLPATLARLGYVLLAGGVLAPDPGAREAFERRLREWREAMAGADAAVAAPAVVDLRDPEGAVS